MPCPKASTGLEKLAPTGWHVFATLLGHADGMLECHNVMFDFHNSHVMFECHMFVASIIGFISAQIGNFLLVYRSFGIAISLLLCCTNIDCTSTGPLDF